MPDRTVKRQSRKKSLPGVMYWFVRLSTTKPHRMGGLNKWNLLFHNFRDCKSNTRVGFPWGLFPWWPCDCPLHLAFFLSAYTLVPPLVSQSLLILTICYGPPWWLHFNSTISLKTLSITTVAFWSTLSYAFNIKFWREHNLAPNRQKSKVSLLLSQCRRFQCTDRYSTHTVSREFLRYKGELAWGV